MRGKREYEGTLDLVMIHSLTEAEIDDWKSYYQVIDADTFQSKFIRSSDVPQSIPGTREIVLEFLRLRFSPWSFLWRARSSAPIPAPGQVLSRLLNRT